MQGIAKHRYAASAFHEGVCRVSVRLNAPRGNERQRISSQRSESKSKAVSHWRRWFIEVFSLHSTAMKSMEPQRMAMQRSAGKSNAASPSRRVVRVVFGSWLGMALKGMEKQRISWKAKASKSNAARPFNEWLCREAFLSSAIQRQAHPCTA